MIVSKRLVSEELDKYSSGEHTFTVACVVNTFTTKL